MSAQYTLYYGGKALMRRGDTRDASAPPRGTEGRITSKLSRKFAQFVGFIF